MMGKPQSEQKRQKLREANLGKTLSVDGKSKLAKAHTNNRCVSLIDSKGNVYTNIDNISDFSRQHNLNVGHLSNVVNGKEKSVKGFKLYETYQCGG